MKQLWPTVQLDVMLAARSQLYSMGVTVSVLLGLALRYLIPEPYMARALVAFYLLGLGGTTLMFSASLLLMEKSQGTLAALRTSPMTTPCYVLSKVTTLTTFAIVESAIVYGVAGATRPEHMLLFLLGLTALGAFYVLLGLALAAAHDSVTRFLFPGAIVTSMVVQLPVLSLWNIGPAWLWWSIPSTGPMKLIQGSLLGLSTADLLLAFGLSVALLAVMYGVCARRFARWIRFAREPVA